MKNYLDFLGNYLIKINIKKLIFILLIISIFKNGFWYHPGLWNMLEIAKNPFANIFGEETNKYYLYSSWLSPYLSYLLNFNTKISFFLFHLFFSFSFLIYFFLLIKKFVNIKYWNRSIIVFFIFPISMAPFYWVGYDSLLLLLIVMSIYYNKNLIVVLLCSLGIGLQHFEIGFVAITILLLCKIFELIIYSKKKNTTFILNYSYIVFFFLGLIIGKIILFKIYSQANFATGRLDWISNSLLHLIYNFYFNFYNIIWFSLGVGWFFILKYFFDEKNKSSLIISLMLLLAILPIVDDHTRVYSSISFIILIVHIICNNNFLRKISKCEITVLFTIWLLMPYSWVWQGDLRQSMFQYNLAYVLNYFFDIFNNNIESSTIWPFMRFK